LGPLLRGRQQWKVECTHDRNRGSANGKLCKRLPAALAKVLAKTPAIGVGDLPQAAAVTTRNDEVGDAAMPYPTEYPISGLAPICLSFI